MEKPRSIIHKLLFSETERRLHAGWRISIQTILYLAFSLTLVFPSWFLLKYSQAEAGIVLLVIQIASTAAMILSILLARCFLDHRSFTSLGLRRGGKSWRDMIVGFLISGLILLSVYVTERWAGWLRLESFAWNDTPSIEIFMAVIIYLSAFIATGFQEELFFRGYLLQNIREGINLIWGIVLSSIIFGAVHLANQNATLGGAIGVALAGLFMAFAAWRSGQLWLPIGIHIGWNFFEGPVLGFPVSGISTFRLFHIQVGGPVLYTGGDFGPEAGLVSVVGLFLGALLVYFYTRSSDHWVGRAVRPQDLPVD